MNKLFDGPSSIYVLFVIFRGQSSGQSSVFSVCSCCIFFNLRASAPLRFKSG
ncbi:MAG TPA: hypothetical protein VH598_16045 [Verrucomicrobiae bacterium]|nr:hypothetical protein [Verrucomicrobiae bacterium]